MKPSQLPHGPSKRPRAGPSTFTAAPAWDGPRSYDAGPPAHSIVAAHGIDSMIAQPIGIAAAAIGSDSGGAWWLEDFVIEVRHSAARWRIVENGASICAFVYLEDAVPLALAYAQARGDAGHEAVVFLKSAAAPRLCMARYGPVAKPNRKSPPTARACYRSTATAGVPGNETL